MSATVGIGITKLFHLSQHFDSLRWVAGALSVGVASALMGLTKTVHPPAGATALICATDPTIVALGWFLLPVIILGIALLLFVACIVNNIQRRFPIYWWSPAQTKSPKQTADHHKSPTNNSDLQNGYSTSLKSPGSIEPEVIQISKTHFNIPPQLNIEPSDLALLRRLQSKLQASS